MADQGGEVCRELALAGPMACVPRAACAEAVPVLFESGLRERYVVGAMVAEMRHNRLQPLAVRCKLAPISLELER